MADPDDDERTIELDAIAAIFPELVVDTHNRHIASLELEINPRKPIHIVFEEQENTVNITVDASDRRIVEDTHHLDFLPYFRVSIELPLGYPEVEPPCFAVKSSPEWIPPATLKRLNQAGQTLWKEYGRSQVVFAFIDMLQQEAEEGLGLAASPLHLAADLKSPLLSFNRLRKRQKFEQRTFECGICLSAKSGSVCYSLRGCNHVFCIACLQDFYNSLITEGDIVNVTCPDADCGKDPSSERKRTRRTLHPTELLDIPMPEKQVQRYVDMKIKKLLESDRNTIWCPRQFCQAPARSQKYAKYLDTRDLAQFPEDVPEAKDPADAEQEIESDDDLVNKMDRLAICSKCSYAFCRRCNKGWHGDYVACRIQNTKTELSADEKASEDYIRCNTTPCPQCDVPVVKSHGCNHMRCYQCSAHFCYLCSGWLPVHDPYKHFNTRGTDCYQRLFEHDEGDDGVDPANFGGIRALEAQYLAAQEVAEGLGFEVNNAAAQAPVAGPAANAAVAGEVDNDGHGRGLQHFLELAANHEEDGWDSDEMEQMERHFAEWH